MSKIREFLFTLLKDERGMMVGLVSVVAVAGWGLALASMGGSGGLEEKLLAAEADLTVTKAEVSKMSAEIAAAREVQQGIQEATTSLSDMAKQLESDQVELAALTLKIDAVKARLGTLRAEAAVPDVHVVGPARDDADHVLLRHRSSGSTWRAERWASRHSRSVKGASTSAPFLRPSRQTPATASG